MRPVIMGCGYSSLVRIVIVDAVSLLIRAWWGCRWSVIRRSLSHGTSCRPSSESESRGGCDLSYLAEPRSPDWCQVGAKRSGTRKHLEKLSSVRILGFM
jgi:hypothetical protein